ncbi:MAG: RsmB/NOP family class I SAM-dependent RNA methyltransferase [Acidilobaceae archaeon]
MSGLDSRVFAPYEFTREVLELSQRYGYEPSIVYRLVEAVGVSEAERVLEANEKPLPETIRCNDYLVDCSELEARLEAKGFELRRIEWLPHGYEVSSAPISVGATHEYLLGYYYVQDPGSMLAGYLLDPKPGELIIDMCAAPGGKATQILQLTRDKARLIAVEKSRLRMRSLRSHLQRMGFKSFVLVRADALSLPEELKADRILLDAPSSGEGVIRKDPSRKKRGRLEDIRRMHELQVRLLEKALRLLREGGVVLYAACSTAVEEGEYVVHKVLESRSDATVVRLEHPVLSRGVTSYRGVELDPRLAHCGRLWPHIQGYEGFFVCMLARERR